MVKISARDIILLYGTIPKVEISPSKKHGKIDERPKVLIHRVILIVNKIRIRTNSIDRKTSHMIQYLRSRSFLIKYKEKSARDLEN